MSVDASSVGALNKFGRYRGVVGAAAGSLGSVMANWRCFIGQWTPAIIQAATVEVDEHQGSMDYRGWNMTVQPIPFNR